MQDFYHQQYHAGGVEQHTERAGNTPSNGRKPSGEEKCCCRVPTTARPFARHNVVNTQSGTNVVRTVLPNCRAAEDNVWKWVWLYVEDVFLPCQSLQEIVQGDPVCFGLDRSLMNKGMQGAEAPRCKDFVRIQRHGSSLSLSQTGQKDPHHRDS